MFRLARLTSVIGLLSVLFPASSPVWGAGNGVSAPTFADALRAAGWQVETLKDGSLQVIPGAGAEARTSASPVAPDQRDEATGWPMLRRAGWRVETQPDGSTLLFPPRPAAPGVVEPAPEPAPIAPVAAPATPPALATPAQPQPQAVPQANAEPMQPAAQDELASALETILRERGWYAVREADGSMLLAPRGAVATAPTAVAPSREGLPPAVGAGLVSLPIDRWRNALTVARSWLEATGDETLRIGKIRRVLKVYLVTVVDAERSFILRHQLAIGVDDGHITVLYSRP